MAPLEFKKINDVKVFKSEIRKWKPKVMRMYVMSAIYTSYANISNN